MAVTIAAIFLASCGSGSDSAQDEAGTESVASSTADSTTPPADPTTSAADPTTTSTPETTTPPVTITEPTTTPVPSTAAPETTLAPTTTSAPAAGPAVADLPDFVTGAVAAASADGIDVRFSDGTGRRILDEPAAIALIAGGDVVFQRDEEASSEGTETAVERWNRETASIEAVELMNPTGGPITIFDFTLVDGAPILLFEAGPSNCNAGRNCDSVLVTQDLNSGEAGEVDQLNTFEAGWLGLTLAENGWIVGTLSENIAITYYSNSIGPDPAPTAQDVGIEASYADCDACPVAYSINPDATAVSWIAKLDDGTPVLVKSTFDGIPFRVEYSDSPDLPCRHDASTAMGDQDGPTTGYFIVAPCPFADEVPAVAVELVDDFVGETVVLRVDVYYDVSTDGDSS